jgi:hypothetical protein
MRGAGATFEDCATGEISAFDPTQERQSGEGSPYENVVSPPPGTSRTLLVSLSTKASRGLTRFEPDALSDVIERER